MDASSDAASAPTTASASDVKTSRPSHASKRSSMAVPKPPTSLDATAVIANHATLTGVHPISIGANTVVHPHARIVSTYCPVEIGAGCIISEKAVVGLSDVSQDLSEGSQLPEKVVLRDNVKVECCTIIEASEIDEYTTIDVEARVGAGATVGRHCHISPRASVPAGTHVPDFTVIFGINQRRTNLTLQTTPLVGELQAKGHEKQLKLQHRLIPNNLAKWQ